MELNTNDLSALRVKHFDTQGANELLVICDHTFVGELIFYDEGRLLHGIVFTRCIFKEQLNIKQSNGYRNLNFLHCIFEQTIQFEYLKSGLSLQGSHCSSALVLNGAEEQLILQDFNVGQGFHLYGEYRGGLRLAGINKTVGLEPTNVSELHLEAGQTKYLNLTDCCFAVIDFGKLRAYDDKVTLDGVTGRSVNLQH